jgi:starvation-inducible DNA-binding protein
MAKGKSGAKSNVSATAAIPFNTSVGLSNATRGQMVAMLGLQLADTFDLASHCKQAHWNVRGPEFMELHKLFDMLAEGVGEYVDPIAERITALGGEAMGTVRMAASVTRLREYPTGELTGMQHVRALAERFAMLANSTRADIDVSAEAGDAITSDLLTGIGHDLDKWLWFLEAHLED